MTDEKKKDIEETVEVLKGLDKQSMTLIKSNVEILKARQDLEQVDKPKDKPKKTG
ncbi:hypothetical protein OBO34_07320 [Clostridiales Family XIII bacterium ASD5510]|uniref:Uncharacterized protein n=1 Tax=Hominibacterium faecale TaxID=2839743 RepID=A0A9J6QTQ7_9FIRM|nr:hypothetical protein [Hominibacterium faecale]MCU7378163.1 hypothetical protein [Hominibacterium faecale]